MSQPSGYSPPQGPMKHSRLGIASFIVSVASYILGFGALFVLNMGARSFSFGPFCTCGMPMGLWGILLGILALRARDKKKVFAYLGLGLGVLIVVINGVLIRMGWIS